ncbi:MAG: hypothetical protein IJA99_06685 [Oscillospiraceae bacterium]|nr:hypothetical protein [Oscillospiraceae bacterium]
MENFKKTLKKRVLFGTIYCLSIPVLTILLHWIIGSTRAAGFTSGFASGLAGVALYYVIQSARALKDEEKARAIYIKENDEREQIIGYCTAKATYLTMLVLLSIAMLVTAYIDYNITLILAAVTLIIAVCSAIWRAYYNKKL